MRRIRTIRLWLRSLFAKREVDAELSAELRFHLERETANNEAAGMSQQEARRAALLEFGGAETFKEDCRDERRVNLFQDLAGDVRHGFRMLRRSPGFTAAAVLSLALGIGASTAIFSVMDVLLLRTLPVRNPEQLVIFDPVFQGRGSNGSTSYAVYEKLRGLTDFFSGVAASADVDRSNIVIQGAGGGTDSGQVHVSLVSGNYFETVGVQARIGRTIGTEDDRTPGANPVAVIGYGYWERRFGHDRGAVGRTLQLNATTYTIIGVMPRAFSGLWMGRPVDLWIPTTMVAQVVTELPPQMVLRARMPLLVQVVARLKPGVQVGQARAASAAVHQQFQRGTSPNLTPQDQDRLARISADLIPAAKGFSPRREALAQPLGIVAIMVGLVLLIACANVANLLLARSAGRQREMAVRLALGAGAVRILRQLLTESVLLAGLGGALGVLFASWAMNAFVRLAGSGPIRSPQQAMKLEIHADARALIFTSLLCVATGVLFGLAPARRAARTSISPLLGERAGNSGEPARRLGKILVVSQVALSLMLLVGAGLFMRTLRALKAEDLGFDRDRLLLTWIEPRQTGRWGATTASLYETIEQRLSALPGVMAVSPSVYGMLQGNTNPGTILDVPGYTPRTDDDTRAQWSIVGPGFFDALGLQLISGRNFTDHDTTTATQVAIINESMAAHYFGNESPLGKQFNSWGITKQIVGVVRDAKYESPRQVGMRMFYLPYRQQLDRLTQTVSVVVRTAGPPVGFARQIRQTLHDIDASLPVLRTETVDDQLNEVLAPERVIATLAGFFGGVAALLACLGVYGVIAYAVSRRTNEIGVRVALGAQRANVMGMVVKESLVLVATGVAIGLPAALIATRLISSRLYGVGPADPATIIGATTLMLAVAALAGFFPAYRASRVDPIVALRYE